jgi:hypothetical protein
MGQKYMGRMGRSSIKQLRNSKECVRAQSDLMLKKYCLCGLGGLYYHLN